MIYIFLANGFEEIEALTPLDLLRRAELEVKTVGIGGNLVTGAHGITVKADLSDAEYLDHMPEAIILPGGMPGTNNLNSSSTVDTAIKFAVRNNAYLAAICAAPMVLGTRGLLRGKNAVCYPGFEKYLLEANVQKNAAVVIDGKIITARGAGVALEFGLALISVFKGKECASKLRRTVLAEI